MDIRLQGSIDGIAAAQEIHGRFNIPIIYLSAQSREEILERVRTDGSSAFLKKPYYPDELRGAIQSVLEPK
jgi:two-component system, response regulator PdtaR